MTTVIIKEIDDIELMQYKRIRDHDLLQGKNDVTTLCTIRELIMSSFSIRELMIMGFIRIMQV